MTEPATKLPEIHRPSIYWADSDFWRHPGHFHISYDIYLKKKFGGQNCGPKSGRKCTGPQNGGRIRTQDAIPVILIYYTAIFGQIKYLLKF